jgi:trans-aconitate methyltransferase
MTNNWDANDGRQQTRLFAKYFLDTVTLPRDAKTFLDVSCAKGDALPVIRARYKDLELFGQDFSEVAIEEARQSYGTLARFEVASIESVSREYDVIFCSNTLEHFENYLDIAQGLLEHCRWLYIMVPFMELRRWRRLSRESGEQHVATFDEHSFQPLIERGAALRIQHWVRYTPGAWGTGPVSFFQQINAFLRLRPVPFNYRQIIYEVSSAATLSQRSG